MKLRRKRMMKVKIKKITNSFKYAGEGFYSSFKTERNMKFHIMIMILVIIAGILLKISKSEWIICIICFTMVKQIIHIIHSDLEIFSKIPAIMTKIIIII